MIKPLNFKFPLSYHHILLAHYSLKQIHQLKPWKLRLLLCLILIFLTLLFYHVFFFYFSIIDLYFVIPEVIAQIFNPIAELIIPTGIPSKEVKAGIEIHSVIVEP